MSDDINFEKLGDDELLDIDAVCRFFGGNNRPFDPCTIYRGVRRGIYPRPVKTGTSDKPGAKGNRWMLGECRIVKRSRIEARAAEPEITLAK